MPLGVVRKKPSLKDTTRQLDHDSPSSPELAHPRASTSAPNDLLRPESAAERRYPASRSSQQYNSRASFSTRPPSSSGASVASTKVRQRLGLMRSRYASDSQLASRYKAHLSSSSFSDAAPAPTIGVTAPPSDVSEAPKKSVSRLLPFFRSKPAATLPRSTLSPSKTSWTGPRPSMEPAPRRSNAWSAVGADGVSATSEADSSVSGDVLSDSYPGLLPGDAPKASVNGFFKFGRRKRKENQLFPMPAELEPPRSKARNVTPRASFSPAPSVVFRSDKSHADVPSLPNSPQPAHGQVQDAATNGDHADTSDITIRPVSGAVTFVGPAPPLLRHSSSASNHSIRSIPNQPHPSNLRSRSNTLKSFPGMIDHERNATTTTLDSGRASTTSMTIGRNSMAGLRSLTSRLRHPSEPVSASLFTSSNAASNTPTGSASHSFAISRETLVVPDREEGETAGKYFNRLEQDFPKKSIALAFSKSSDTFSHDVLRSLMRTFKFYEEPMDISLRRFLWEIDLPGEAQQIDRVISAFAERYHECNPHIFETFDEAYLIAYSLIILHSDLFNKNNKHKMQRSQYQKNTGGHGVHDDILGYFYDNIQYTEFIAQNLDDDESDKKAKSAMRKAKKATTKLVPATASESARLDPYSSIIDDNVRLEILRNPLREVLNLDDSYNYSGSSASLDIPKMRTAFNRYGVLQVVSSRSRPDAFVDPMTMVNPMEALPGVVDIKVAKVGTLWRKELKKKKGRSPWQEWGAVLTASQLYFFRSSSWVRGLVSQYEHHQKHGRKSMPVVFKPALEEFKYDASVAMVHAVAIQDTTYKKHKHAFVLARQGDMLSDRPQSRYFDEVLLAESDADMEDWLAKLNYAATCTTTNVRLPPKTLSAPDIRTIAVSRPQSKAEDSTNLSVATNDAMTLKRQLSASGPVESATQSLLKSKIAGAEDKVKEYTKILEETLKTARHLEILAPFPNKTRSDLLSFGVRLAHIIKWARYDVLRAKCQRDVLTQELELDDGESTILTAAEADPVPQSPASTAPSVLTGRLNSKSKSQASRHSLIAEVPQPSPRISLSRASFSGSSPSAASNRNSLIAGIDHAFATPSDTLSRFAVSGDGSFKLPPLQLLPSSANVSEIIDENAIETQDESPSRRSSTSSVASSAAPAQEADLEQDAAPSRSSMQTEKPSRAVVSAPERGDENGMSSSPQHRSSQKMRRSLQRTLRDSRERGSSPHHTLSHSSRRRHKDSFSSHSTTTNTEDGRRLSVQDTEGLTRRPGSFKIHGKKASVITLGAEWQKVSPEERLRQRRQVAQTDDGAGGLTKYHTARSSMQNSPRLGKSEGWAAPEETASGDEDTEFSKSDNEAYHSIDERNEEIGAAP